ncbi:hypothetical protein AMECASPLE_004317, partial [Ameca splendens]
KAEQKQIIQQEQLSLEKARLEVHRFGITGYKKEQQRVFEQDRAIMLGARPPKKDYVNYKGLQEQIKEKKQKEKEEFQQDKKKKKKSNQRDQKKQPAFSSGVAPSGQGQGKQDKNQQQAGGGGCAVTRRAAGNDPDFLTRRRSAAKVGMSQGSDILKTDMDMKICTKMDLA